MDRADFFYRKQIPVPIPAGSLFTITTGAYSDYCVQGIFRALVEIDVTSLIIKWYQKQVIGQDPDRPRMDENGFLASISNMMEQIDCYEMHLSDYDRFGEASVSKVGEPY